MFVKSAISASIVRSSFYAIIAPGTAYQGLDHTFETYKHAILSRTTPTSYTSTQGTDQIDPLFSLLILIDISGHIDALGIWSARDLDNVVG